MYDIPEADHYDVAEICLNGHVITDAIRHDAHHRAPHCKDCGASTITQCQECRQDIKGHFFSEYGALAHYSAPAFCEKCGKPFPWTKAAIDAANVMAQEVANLNEEERKQLASTFDDILRQTPKTSAAALRFKRLISKSGKVAMEVFKDFIVKYGAEAAKQIILGG